MENNSHSVLDDVCTTLSKCTASEEDAFKDSVEVVKQNDSSYVGIYEFGDSASRLFVKCYHPKYLAHNFFGLLSISRPFQTFNKMRQLESLFPVSAPLAIVRNKQSGNVYLFSRLLTGFSLTQLLTDNSLTGEYKKNVLAAVGAALARLHKLGWSHGDFKWSNIFIDGVAGERFNEIYFIDLDGVRSKPWGNLRSYKGRDIARFIVNAEDYDMDEEIIRSFIAQYALVVGETEKDSLRMSVPALKKLRERHDKKYGLRHRSLFKSETES